jgi:hypothetical protein
MADSVFNRQEPGMEYLRSYQPKHLSKRDDPKFEWCAKSKAIKHKKVERICFENHQMLPNVSFFTKIQEIHFFHVHLHPVIIVTSPVLETLKEIITAQDFLDLAGRNGTHQFYLVHDMAEPTKYKAQRWLKWCHAIGLRVAIVATKTKGKRCRLGRM